MVQCAGQFQQGAYVNRLLEFLKRWVVVSFTPPSSACVKGLLIQETQLLSVLLIVRAKVKGL